MIGDRCTGQLVDAVGDPFQLTTGPGQPIDRGLPYPGILDLAPGDQTPLAPGQVAEPQDRSRTGYFDTLPPEQVISQ